MRKTNRFIAMILVLAIVASLFTMTASAYSEVSYGSYGSDVKELQKMLNKVANAGLVVDGDFGNGTYNAVKAFQRSCGLVADGIVGAKTWNALSAKYSAATSPASTLRIGSGSYSPGTLSLGKSYSISGTISSNYKITSVTAGVYTTSGAATSQVKTVSPNSTSYNISNLDYYIAFGSLASGTYRFKVIAKDASGANKTLVNNQFTVEKISTLKIGSGSYPEGSLNRGQSFSISGLVTSNYKINSVTVSIHSYSGGSTTVQTKTGYPNATSYNINKLDSYIKFGSLAAGSYIFKVTAKDVSGAEKTISTSFTVQSSTLKIGSGSYSPGTLSSGKSYSISGTITSNYKITSVTAGVYTTSGAATAQVKTVSPNTTSYNISNLDYYIAFGSLAAGSYRFKVSAKDASGTSKTLVDNPFTVKATVTASSYPEIWNGSSGYYVEELQRMLNKVSNAGLSVDGDFGNGTEQAVVSFQKSCGLDADGIVGTNTWNALKAKYSASTSSGSSTTTQAPSTSSNSAALNQKILSLANLMNGADYIGTKDRLNYFNGTGFPKGVNWCGYYVDWILNKAYAEVGIDVNLPDRGTLSMATNTADAYYKEGYGTYFGFTRWYYEGNNTYDYYPTGNRNSYTPKVGDILLIETNFENNDNGTSDGPDHLGVIIEVYTDGSFRSSEGNTGNSDATLSKVSQHTYKNIDGIWYRNGNYNNCYVHAVCRPDLP